MRSMGSYEERVNTYKSWSRKFSEEYINKLSIMGQYSIDSELHKTKCFYCGLETVEWDKKLDLEPFSVHFKDSSDVGTQENTKENTKVSTKENIKENTKENTKENIKENTKVSTKEVTKENTKEGTKGNTLVSSTLRTDLCPIYSLHKKSVRDKFNSLFSFFCGNKSCKNSLCIEIAKDKQFIFCAVCGIFTPPNTKGNENINNNLYDKDYKNNNNNLYDKDYKDNNNNLYDKDYKDNNNNLYDKNNNNNLYDKDNINLYDKDNINLYDKDNINLYDKDNINLYDVIKDNVNSLNSCNLLSHTCCPNKSCNTNTSIKNITNTYFRNNLFRPGTNNNCFYIDLFRGKYNQGIVKYIDGIYHLNNTNDKELNRHFLYSLDLNSKSSSSSSKSSKSSSSSSKSSSNNYTLELIEYVINNSNCNLLDPASQAVEIGLMKLSEEIDKDLKVMEEEFIKNN